LAGIAIMAFAGNWSGGIKPNEWGDIFAGLFAPVAAREKLDALQSALCSQIANEIARSTAEGKSVPRDQYGICRGGWPKPRRQRQKP
jgi:hypothetical protein